jgi:hypothetical protein
MIRTQVYFTEEQDQLIELQARRERRSKAEVVRDIVDRGLAASASTRTSGQALLELAELGKQLNLSGPTDLSANHDNYLYGDKE